MSKCNYCGSNNFCEECNSCHDCIGDDIEKLENEIKLLKEQLEQTNIGLRKMRKAFADEFKENCLLIEKVKQLESDINFEYGIPNV